MFYTPYAPNFYGGGGGGSGGNGSSMFTIISCHVVGRIVYYTVLYKNGQYQIFPESIVLLYAPYEVMKYHMNNGQVHY